MMGKLKNFDSLRLWAAASVIFSHSYLIAEGVEDNEPLQQLTGEILGIYGVFVFFILSGFLITRSRLTSASTAQYLWKRFLRIYPAYFVGVLVTVIVICPFFVDGSVIDFLTRRSTWSAVGKVLLFANGANNDSLLISGFSFYPSVESWSMGSIINAVFWTIKIEILLYLAVALLFSTRLLAPWFVALLAAGSAAAFFLDLYPGWHLWGISIGAPGFFTGSLLYFIFDRYGARAWIAVLCIAGLALATYVGLLNKLFPLLAAYPLLYLGTSQAPDLGNWRRFGDISYGIYLWGWPIQQVIRAFLGDSWAGWQFFMVCMPAAALCGWLSWHLIEQPALAYKKRHLSNAEAKQEKPAYDQAP